MLNFNHNDWAEPETDTHTHTHEPGLMGSSQ